jgi:DNA-binding NarL/FixJ family response regulator
MFHRGWFWFDADSTLLTSGIADDTHHYGVVRTGRLADAVDEIARDPARWAGVVTQFRGQFKELEMIRRQSPMLPVLALLSQPEPALVSALDARGIETAVPFAEGPHVTAFIQRSFAAAFVPNERVANLVQAFASRAGLSSREVQILAYSLANEPREVMRKRLGVSENTLKSQIKGLLRKSGERTLDGLAKDILRAALIVEQPRTPIRSVAPLLSVAC